VVGELLEGHVGVLPEPHHHPNAVGGDITFDDGGKDTSSGNCDESEEEEHSRAHCKRSRKQKTVRMQGVAEESRSNRVSFYTPSPSAPRNSQNDIHSSTADSEGRIPTKSPFFKKIHKATTRRLIFLSTLRYTM